MTDMGEYLKRPFSDWKSLLIGTLLALVPIVHFFSMGFAARAGKMAYSGQKGLPTFSDWGDLFIKGLLLTVISLIWLLPAIILVLVLGGAALFSGLQGVTNPGLGAILGLGVGVILALVVAIVFSYFASSAMMNYIVKGSFGAAFDFGTVFAKAFTGQFFIAWIVSIVLGMVLGLVLQFVPYIGGALGSFLTWMWTFMLIGNAYK